MAMTKEELRRTLEQDGASDTFTPYMDLSEKADALTVYFKPDPDYSKRLTDHVTLFLSVEDDKIVGCRIKGVKGILEDLPNWLRVNHDGVELSIIFWSFRGGIEDEQTRRALEELVRGAGDMKLEPA